MYEVKNFFKPFLFVSDVIGYIFFGWIKLKHFKKPKKILCIRLENLGDVLLTTPAFRALKKKFPDAEVDVLVRSIGKEVLEGNVNVDNILVFDFPWFGFGTKTKSWLETIKFVNFLRSKKYDLVIDFHSDPRNIIVSFLVGKFRLGYAVKGLGFLLNRVAHFNGDQNQININLDLVGAIGAKDDCRLDFAVLEKDEIQAKNFFDYEKFIVLSPIASRKNKCWVNKKWSKLADKLIVKYGYGIVFTGSAGDYEQIKKITENMTLGVNAVNLAGKTSIKQLGAIIKNARLIVCPDSGPAHIAKAFNKNCLTLFAEENPIRWGHSSYNSKFIKRKNLKKLKVFEVLEEIDKLSI